MADKREDILRCGRELFSTKGFKATNIAEITKMAGIATGTFYIYYPSKEKLFMEIYLEENAKLAKKVMDSINLDDEPTKLILQMLALNMAGMQSNPILSQWYNRDVFDKIERLYREENGLDSVDFLYKEFILIVQKWQLEGKMRNDISSEMIMAMFGAIITVGTHKEEIGLQYFPKVQDYMTEFILKGLTDTGKSSG